MSVPTLPKIQRLGTPSEALKCSEQQNTIKPNNFFSLQRLFRTVPNHLRTGSVLCSEPLKEKNGGTPCQAEQANGLLPACSLRLACEVTRNDDASHKPSLDRQSDIIPVCHRMVLPYKSLTALPLTLSARIQCGGLCGHL